MASMAYEIAQELYVIKNAYKAEGRFYGSMTIDIAVDWVDGVSKRHLPPVEYLETLERMFTNAPLTVEEDDERDAWVKALSVIKNWQNK